MRDRRTILAKAIDWMICKMLGHSQVGDDSHCFICKGELDE